MLRDGVPSRLFDSLMQTLYYEIQHAEILKFFDKSMNLGFVNLNDTDMSHIIPAPPIDETGDQPHMGPGSPVTL